MRIVSWNCCCGFYDEKIEIIKRYNADILVIPECREMDMEKTGYDEKYRIWYGDHIEATYDSKNVNKNMDRGIGIFWNDNVKITLVDKSDIKFRYVVPFNVKYREKNSFSLFAIWTKAIDSKKEQYPSYLTPVLKTVEPTLSFESTIFVGDFNTGSIQGANNASEYEKLKDTFEKKGIWNCATGQEWIPTFFRGNNSWLDDHCFATKDLQVVSFGIGNPDYWRKYSDHCPICIDFDL